MAKKNRECLTCGTKYTYCPNCNRKEPSWMVEFHEENCKNIFQICTQYNIGLLTKEQAQEALIACDISNEENFAQFIKQDFAKIFAVEEPKKRNKKVEAPVIEEAPVEQVHEVVKQENE